MMLHAVRHPAQWWRKKGPSINKRVLNPVMLHLAGRRLWYASRLDHVGRRSGRPFATPVVAHAVPGGFAIPLPYGRDVDWLRNLEAAGHATLVHGGRHIPVTKPRVVPFEDVAPDLPWLDRVINRQLVGGDWLLVTAPDATAAAEPVA